MALIKCPECGKEVSDKAKACIHCGFPLEDAEMVLSPVNKSDNQPTKKTAYRCSKCGVELKKWSGKCPSCEEWNTIGEFDGAKKQDTTQSHLNDRADTNHQPIGFTLFSFDETNVSLECKNCSKVYRFNKETYFSEVSGSECIPHNTICCPNCGNTVPKGIVIYRKQYVSPQMKSIQQMDKSNKQEESSGIGCLIFPIITFTVSLFLVTDCFRDLALWWVSFPLTFSIILGGGLLYSLLTSDPKEVKENWDKDKYNNYKFTCPMCGSKKVKKIGTMIRAASVAAVGLASSRIGKQYECDACKHKW